MKTGVASLTPADIERLLREHSFMLSLLYDVSHRLTGTEAILSARAALTAIMDNAVESDGKKRG